MMTLDKKKEANKDFQKTKVAKVIAILVMIFSVSISFQSLDSGKRQQSTELLDTVVIAENSQLEMMENAEIKRIKSRTVPQLFTSTFLNSKSEQRLLRGTPSIAKKYAKTKIKSSKDFKCLVELWNRESQWSVTSKNSSSGAYGIPQALPGKKMASQGKDWKNSYKTQVDWGIKYIKSRYGTACGALSHHNKYNWY